MTQRPGADRAQGDDEPTVTVAASGGPPSLVRRALRLSPLAALVGVALLLGVLSVVTVRAVIAPAGKQEARDASPAPKVSRKSAPRPRSTGWLGVCEHYARGRVDLAMAASEREQPAPVARHERLWMIQETCEPYRQLLDTCRQIDRGGVGSVVPATLEPDVREAYVRELKALCADNGR